MKTTTKNFIEIYAKQYEKPKPIITVHQFAQQIKRNTHALSLEKSTDCNLPAT